MLKNRFLILDKNTPLISLEDKFETFKPTVDKVTGFLTSKVVLARTGVQHYLGAELGLSDRKFEKIGVLRSAEEVFSQKSIDTFKNMVVTDDHPSDDVTVDNVNMLQKGSVSEVKRVGDTLVGIITITDKKLIQKIIDGKNEVSVGYSQILVKLKGEDGEGKYEFAQTNIVGNHLAVVDAGRCGQRCKINLGDHKKENIMIITIDGVEYTVEDKQLAQAITSSQAKQAKDAAEFKEKMSKAEEEKEKMKKEKEDAEKEKDTAKAEKDAAVASKISDADLSKLVDAKAKVLADGKRVLGDEFPECNNCDKEIKAAVVAKVLPDMDIKGQSDAYIEAAYDIALKKFDKAKKTVDKLGEDLTDKDGKVITRDSVRNQYMTETEGGA